MKKNVSKKYAQVMATLPRILNAGDAEDYVAGHAVLKELSELHGLKSIQRKRLIVYDRFDIDQAIDRMNSQTISS